VPEQNTRNGKKVTTGEITGKLEFFNVFIETKFQKFEV